MPGFNNTHFNNNASEDSHNLPMNVTETISTPVVSATVLWWLRMIVVGFLGQAMASFGVISNAINIVVYTKLGVKEPINVSFIGMSISDLLSCLTIIWYNLCMFPPFMELKLPFDQRGAYYLFGGWPHGAFVKITICITAFITIERCICVTFPLKVKEIITTKRVIIITASFYISIIIMTVPFYYVSYYAWVFWPERNRTIYTLVFTEDRDEIEPPLLFLIGVFIPIISFVLIIIATVILVYTLNKNSKWQREATTKTTSSTSSQPTSSRDAKVAKMVVTISVLYLISFSPVMTFGCVMLSDLEIKAGGLKENLLHALVHFTFFFETTNAALNMLIYYFMSTNYKSMFDAIFKRTTNLVKLAK